MARILIVDDEPDVLAAMKASLEDAGHNLVAGIDGGQAFDLAVEHGPELVFLDLNMPRIDGFEALMTLKADARTKDIPVIVVSAKGRPEDRLRTRAMGASDYINKPWGDGELVMRANLALLAAARKQAAPVQEKPATPPVQPAGQPGQPGLTQQRVALPQTVRPSITRRVVTYTRPVVRRTVVYQQSPATMAPQSPQAPLQAAPQPPSQAAASQAAPRPPQQSPQSPRVEASSPRGEPPVADATASAGAGALGVTAGVAGKEPARLAAARFIVQHEYSSNQPVPAMRNDSKSAIILRPIEDPDWVVRFDTFDNPTIAAQAPGDPYRFVYGVRGGCATGAQLAIFAEWELVDRDNCARFEANRTALFEIHRRQFAGMVSEWLLKRLDDTPRYTVLALFGDEDAAVRFRAFNPPAQFAAAQMQAKLGATELFGQCACRVKRPGQP